MSVWFFFFFFFLENQNRDVYAIQIFIFFIFCNKKNFRWVSDCCLTPVIFQIYHGENKLIFNEMMMRSALF
jgi:hypothetical protein